MKQQQLLQQQQKDNETRRYVKWIAIVVAIYAMACGPQTSKGLFEPDPSYFFLVENKKPTFFGEGGTEYLYITTNYPEIDAVGNSGFIYRFEKVRYSPDNTGQPAAPNNDHPVNYYRMAITMTQSETSVIRNYDFVVTATRSPTEKEKEERAEDLTYHNIGQSKLCKYRQLGNSDLSLLRGSQQSQEYRQRLENK